MSRRADWVDLFARIFISAIFILGGLNKLINWGDTQVYMAQHGMPFIPVFQTAAVLIELLGGLMILAGLRAKETATVLFLYLIPTTLIFHAFWSAPYDQVQNQMMHFFKNLTLMGGILHVAAWGVGRFSFDAMRPARSHVHVRPASSIRAA